MITPYSSAVRLNNLGVRYHAEGKFHESDVAHKECSAILEAGGPENAPLLAKSLANRAALYRTFQEYSEAERLFQIAIRMSDRYGPSEGSNGEMLSADVVEENGLLRSFGREVDELRQSKEDVGGGERMGHFDGPEWVRLPRVDGGENVANRAKLIKYSS